MLRMLQIIRILRVDRTLLFRGPKYPFTDYFKGFEKVEVIRKLFGEKTAGVLSCLRVEFTRIGGYMWVNDLDGHITINSNYMNYGDRIDIYLDIIHELCHVKQWLKGRELFDNRYSYVDRPTEIEAYRYTVQEAKRLGLGSQRISEYLKTEWISDSELRRLAKNLDIPN